VLRHPGKTRNENLTGTKSQSVGVLTDANSDPRRALKLIKYAGTLTSPTAWKIILLVTNSNN
jgi:hypothetical protein